MKIKASPLISVVIPTYNHADFLKVAIKSVVEQTYQIFEIVKLTNNNIKLSKSHLIILLIAFLGGIILNGMPCVLPVLSIKILSVCILPFNMF